jgi:AAA domain-containing protein
MADTDPIGLWSETAIDTPTDRGRLQGFISEHKIALVIIDTFASYLMVQDETNNSMVTSKMKPYVDMAHGTSATILFVHHERKNREEGDEDSRAIRGASAILGLAGLSFQLKKVPGGGAGRRLSIVGRYSEIPSALKLDYQDDKYVCQGTPDEFTRKAQSEKVSLVLPLEGIGYTVVEVATKVGMKEKATRVALENACVQGLAKPSAWDARTIPSVTSAQRNPWKQRRS